MRITCAFGGVVAVAGLLTSAAPGQVFEDFEHNNESLYGFAGTTTDNLDLTAGAAHAGSFGAEWGTLVGPAFRTRFDLTTAPGHRYFAHVRVRAAALNGRSYLGIGASPSGCWSAVFGPNTGEIQLQQNASYAFLTVASAPVAIAPNTWYALVVDWDNDAMMTVSLWDDAMTTQLATTAPYSTGLTTPGGLAIRGFATGTGSFMDQDDIGVVGAACYANCDGSTQAPILNVLDFSCFLNRFAAGDTYANCDGSTTAPVLNVLDFSCFLNQFAAGCT